MIRAQGDMGKAEHLFDCGYHEYYWRIVLYNRYGEAVKEQIKNGG